MLKSLSIIIRPEQAKDYDIIRTIIYEAFKELPNSDNNEHILVDALRKANALTIALVAELNKEIVGHIAFSAITINGKHSLGWYGLAPLAVKPSQQKKGIGKMLVTEGLNRLRKINASGCVLVGESEYYQQFGFNNSSTLTLKDIPKKYFMALPFDDKIPVGEVKYHPLFATVSTENEKNEQDVKANNKRF